MLCKVRVQCKVGAHAVLQKKHASGATGPERSFEILEAFGGCRFLTNFVAGRYRRTPWIPAVWSKVFESEDINRNRQELADTAVPKHAKITEKWERIMLKFMKNGAKVDPKSIKMRPGMLRAASGAPVGSRNAKSERVLCFLDSIFSKK